MAGRSRIVRGDCRTVNDFLVKVYCNRVLIMKDASPIYHNSELAKTPPLMSAWQL